ncbi:hypothetical protein A2U01_0070377, partial [Trifolium medium]|nr:hypothetical protein [Trifolium medium]
QPIGFLPPAITIPAGVQPPTFLPDLRSPPLAVRNLMSPSWSRSGTRSVMFKA